MVSGRVVAILLGISGVMAGAASAETTVIRPGSCASAAGSYLLAGDSGALIKVEPGAEGEEDSRVIVFRRRATDGWASQRILRRFDLKLDEDGPTIVNSGAFCINRR